MLAPAANMLLSKYLGLLEEIAIDRQITAKLTHEEILHAAQ